MTPPDLYAPDPVSSDPASPDAPSGVLIGICTFRRASVAETLASLARMDRPADHRVTIAVADNDDTASAQVLVETIAATHPLHVTYIHAPARNISIARNALLDAANAVGMRHIAFLDDDEVVQPVWLVQLLKCQQETGAPAVLGPVRADYAADAPGWMRRGAVHDTRPVMGRDGEILSGYTCNVLLDLSAPAVRGLRFDPARGQSGGEDTAFFHALRAAGGHIGHAPEALVSEDVPAARARLGWLLRRRFRMGQTHGSLIGAGRSTAGRGAAVAVAASKAAACLGLAVLLGADAVRRNRSLMRAALHVGVIASLWGARDLRLYGDTANVAETVPATVGRNR